MFVRPEAEVGPSADELFTLPSGIETDEDGNIVVPGEDF